MSAMKHQWFEKTLLAFAVGAITAALSGCSGGTPSSASLVPRAMKPWMSPVAKSSKMLLYVSDYTSQSVYVYDYPSGTQVGDLTADMDYPYGQCVDKKGDVYIANFHSGETVEYAHGGDSPIAEFDSDGYAVGCTVDSQGDLAVANFFTNSGSGNVYVWTHGKGTPTVYQDAQSCVEMWRPGYDDKGNLIVEGGGGSPFAVCALLKGAKSMTALTFDQSIGYPGGTMWDGKYLTLSDQNYDAKNETAIYQVTLSGSTLKLVGTTVLQGKCFESESDVGQPFVVGTRNTPVNQEQGKVLVGVNLACSGAAVQLWHYPAGGSAFKTLGTAEDAMGWSVSIAP